MAGTLSPNCLALITELNARPSLVTKHHTLTLAALLSRGAIVLRTKPPKPGVFVTITSAGIDLLNWMTDAKFVSYREEALPEIQGAKL